jgi:hypothetical protein
VHSKLGFKSRVIRKLWLSEIKLEIFTSLVYFFWRAPWLGTITNRSEFAVGRSGLKSKQARKNFEVISG